MGYQGRWCYVAYGLDSAKDIGVYNKIRAQQKAINGLTGNCDLVVYGVDNIYTDIYGIKSYINYSENVYDDILILNQYDYLYIRWGAYCKYFRQLLKDKKNEKYTIIVEIPTYPIKAELWGKGKSRFRDGRIIMGIKSVFGGILLQDIVFKSQLKYMDYLTMISYEKDVKGVKCIHIDNGIDICKFQQCSIKKKSSKVIMMIVANLTFSQAIDRVIEGIKQYENKFNIEFRIVGDGDEKSRLIKLVNEYSLQEYVKFLGIKRDRELDILFDECDVAIGSLGMSRDNIVGSTLKTREYMARGIPFVASELETIGEEIEDYVCRIKDDENPVDIEKIIDYVQNVDRERIANIFRNEASKNASWDSQIKKVLQAINY